MRQSELRRLNKMAHLEFKVTRQISTGNGDAYLAQAEHDGRVPLGFVLGELGYGHNERPCSTCGKQCTLEYTLRNLDEINGANLRHLDTKDTLSVPEVMSSVDGDVRAHFNLNAAPRLTAYGNLHPEQKPKKLSAAEAQRALRAQARRAGIRVVKGEYVDDRPRNWVPSNPNEHGRRAERREKIAAAKVA